MGSKVSKKGKNLSKFTSTASRAAATGSYSYDEPSSYKPEMKQDENLETDMYTIAHNISVITSTDLALKNDS